MKMKKKICFQAFFVEAAEEDAKEEEIRNRPFGKEEDATVE